MGQNCSKCTFGNEEELNQITVLSMSGKQEKRQKIFEINNISSQNLNKILFLQKSIKKFLKRRKEDLDPFKQEHQKKASSIIERNNADRSKSSLKKDIKYVENLKLTNATYTGEIKDGQRSGKGTQIWDDGAKYEGEWQNDKANGYGIFYHNDGDVYKGNWLNDKANGQGIYISSDGNRYEGFWIDDVQHGYGTEEWKDGSVYKGYYNMGQKEGYGEYQWANGCSYKGYWKENKIDGNGVYKYYDGRIYEGDFKENEMDGFGKYSWGDGKVYLGNFKNGKRFGLGIYKWNDGRLYIGYWTNSMQHGYGKYFNKQEWKYGRWENGKKKEWYNKDYISTLSENPLVKKLLEFENEKLKEMDIEKS